MALPKNADESKKMKQKNSHSDVANKVHQNANSAQFFNKKPLSDDAFTEEEPLPPLAEAFSPNEVQNLDEKELDILLGIDEPFEKPSDSHSINKEPEDSIDEDSFALPNIDLEEFEDDEKVEFSIVDGKPVNHFEKESTDEISSDRISETVIEENDDDFSNIDFDNIERMFDTDDSNENNQSESLVSNSNDELEDDDIEFSFEDEQSNNTTSIEDKNNDDFPIEFSDENFEFSFEDNEIEQKPTSESTHVDENQHNEDDEQSDLEKEISLLFSDDDDNDNEDEEWSFDDVKKEEIGIEKDENNNKNEDDDDFSIEDIEALLDENDDDNEDWSFTDVQDDEDNSEKQEDDAFTPIYENDDNDYLSKPETHHREENVDEYDENLQKISHDEIPDEEKPFDFYSDDEDDKNTDSKEENKSSKKKSKSNSSGGFKNKFANIKQQILSDIKGEDYKPEEKENDQDLENDFKDDDTSENDNKKKFNAPKINLGFLSFIAKPYMFLVKLCFGLVNFILSVLSKTPIIGKLIQPVIGATKILEKIALFLPIVFIIGIFAFISYLQVPRESEATFPDNGSAVFNEFKYDSKTNSATGLATNTGDVILDLEAKFVVYAITPTINPKSWFIPEEIGECSSKELTEVDIESSEKITVKCNVSDGFIKRASGVLK